MDRIAKMFGDGWVVTEHGTDVRVQRLCYGCNTKSIRYSDYSGNVPGLHILLQVKLLTPFTSGLPFLLCSSFVLTLLIREHCLVVLSFCSIVLRSQTHLQSELRNSLLFLFWL